MRTIVQEYIARGLPISSLFLVEKFRLGVSSATIRSLLVLLEDEGYVYQPHTSAGRIPTTLAYRMYIERMKPKVPQRRIEESVSKKVKGLSERARMSACAKSISEATGECTFLFSDQQGLVISGFTRLLEKQEYLARECMASCAAVLDVLEERVRFFLPRLSREVEVWIGDETYFSRHASVLMVSWDTRSQRGVIGMIGPLRMNYEHNCAMVSLAQSLMEEA